MSVWGPVVGGLLGLGGGLLSASGAKSAANQQNAAMQQALQQQLSEGGNSQALLARLLYGGQGGDAFLKDLLPANRYQELFGRASTGAQPLSDADQRQLQDLTARRDRLQTQQSRQSRPHGNNYAGGSRSNPELDNLNSQIAALTQRAGGDPGVAGRFAPSTDTGGGLLGQFDTLAQNFGKQGDQTLRGYDATTQKLLGDYMGLEDQAKQYGAGQESRIRRDAAQQEVAANRRASSALSARGVGNSTLYNNAATGNSRAINQDAQDRIMNLNDSQIQFLTQLGQGRIGLAGQRAGGRTALDVANQDRNYGLQTNKLNTQLGTLGPLMGATGNTNFAQYAPTASGGGNFAQSFGNTLAGLGGATMGGAFDSLFSGGAPRATTQNATTRTSTYDPRSYRT